jgi:hypothetical protein
MSRLIEKGAVLKNIDNQTDIIPYNFSEFREKSKKKLNLQNTSGCLSNKIQVTNNAKS